MGAESCQTNGIGCDADEDDDDDTDESDGWSGASGRPDMGSEVGAATASDDNVATAAAEDDALITLLLAFAFEFTFTGEASSKSPLSCMPPREIANPSR